MGKIIKTLLCWRAWVLAVMSISAILMLLCEADGVWANIAVKAAGMAVMAATNLLFARWDAQGRLGALAELLGDDDE